MPSKTNPNGKSLRTQKRTSGGKQPESLVEDKIDNGLWDKHECAKYLKTKVGTVERLARVRRIPSIRLAGNKGLRFVPALIREWAVDQSMENFEGGN